MSKNKIKSKYIKNKNESLSKITWRFKYIGGLKKVTTILGIIDAEKIFKTDDKNIASYFRGLNTFKEITIKVPATEIKIKYKKNDDKDIKEGESKCHTPIGKKSSGLD